MLKIYYKNKTNQKVQLLETFVKGSWIHVENPTEVELNTLINDHKIDESLIHDALDPHEMPRIEDEAGNKYIFTRYSNNYKGKVDTFVLLIIIGSDFIMTVSKEPVPFLNLVLNGEGFCTTKKTKLFVQIFLSINHDFKHHVHTISKEVRNLSSRLEQIGNKEVVRFVEYERVLNEFLSSLVPVNIVLENILYGKILRLFEEDEDLIEDVSLSTEQLIELSKATLKNIVNIRESYSTIMSNNLNKTMKLLTSLTIILTIPTIISSFYGMNVGLPLQDHPMMFLYLILGTLVFGFIMIWIFIKKDLL